MFLTPGNIQETIQYQKLRLGFLYVNYILSPLIQHSMSHISILIDFTLEAGEMLVGGQGNVQSMGSIIWKKGREEGINIYLMFIVTIDIN